MNDTRFYSLNRAAALLRADRNLVTMLVQDRQIPVAWIGNAKAIDADGLDRLRAALAEYEGKAVPRPAAAATA